MESVAAAILQRVATSVPKLRELPESETALKPSPDRWSKKEILGHLIDSACNNHQRFVRAQLEDGLTFPGYDQEGWVRCQGYVTADWLLLVELWAAYNQHLAVIVGRLPVVSRAFVCRIGGGEELSFAAVVEDYVRHLDHHLAQLYRTANPDA